MRIIHLFFRLFLFTTLLNLLIAFQSCLIDRFCRIHHSVLQRNFLFILLAILFEDIFLFCGSILLGKECISTVLGSLHDLVNELSTHDDKINSC